jgi:hypothetical protein
MLFYWLPLVQLSLLAGECFNFLYFLPFRPEDYTILDVPQTDEESAAVRPILHSARPSEQIKFVISNTDISNMVIEWVSLSMISHIQIF